MLSKYKVIIDEIILNYFRSLPENTLSESMAYSMNLGGKRLRPSLVLLSSRIFGGEEKEVYHMALAMEMIHTYSLIHDDLPSMDDDDLRRGKPTNHKVFGEANAILAGDALLNEAFTVLLANYAVKSREGAEAALFISRAAGREGMIVGQVYDLENEKKKATLQELVECHNRKTGELIAASLTAPAILLGAEKDEVEKMYAFGIQLGLAFQIQDDILDRTSTKEVLGKSIGKDGESGKSTYVELFGIERSREMAKEATDSCLEILSSINRDTRELAELTAMLLNRTY
ncbi:polyprenyl synthetase family protein [Proteiniclasticum sp. C24MP]|uniref:polyprenyl synthetase family protein n=1 Tax=Proteiniclasticum sp. C24MP TaxID=3374101 RepID=UPI0037546E50